MKCPTCNAPMTPRTYHADDFNSNREDFSYGPEPEVCEECERRSKEALAHFLAAVAS
jgi:hypothetical protein